MPTTEPFDHLRAERGMRGPAWRIELAQAPRTRGARRLPQQYDEQVEGAQAYVGLCRQGTEGRRQASRRFPAVAAAESINENHELCERMKILVLGDCPRPEIARRLGLDEPAIETWEALYFDVRASREATGWVYAHVIWPEQNRGHGARAAKFKLAYCGGPGRAWAILDAETRVPLSAGERLFDRKLKLHLKFDEAVEAPLTTNRDKSRFVKSYAELQLAQQRIRLAERNLETRCREALRKHELAEMRHEAAAERLQQREQERAHRAQQRAQRKREREREKELRSEEDQLLREHQQLAEQQAARARAAASPLAKLTWSSSKPPQAQAEPVTAPAEQTDPRTDPRTDPQADLRTDPQADLRTDPRTAEETGCIVSSSEWQPADVAESDIRPARREVVAV